MTLMQRVSDELHARSGEGLTATQRAIFAFIILSVVLAVVATEPELPEGVREAIVVGELIVGAVFLIEYFLRIWSIPLVPEYAGPGGRLRYMAKPVVILDLVAVLPFLLGAIGAESLLLRLVRVLRLLALSKLMRYSEAMRIVIASVISRRYEMLFAVILASMAILITSAAMYVVEGEAQPKAFGSIARSMWWSVVTLTTVGYGDVVPITPIGKILAGITALAGIGMIAMPTGILAASFADGFARARSLSARPARSP